MANMLAAPIISPCSLSIGSNNNKESNMKRFTIILIIAILLLTTAALAVSLASAGENISTATPGIRTQPPIFASPTPGGTYCWDPVHGFYWCDWRARR